VSSFQNIQCYVPYISECAAENVIAVPTYYVVLGVRTSRSILAEQEAMNFTLDTACAS